MLRKIAIAALLLAGTLVTHAQSADEGKGTHYVSLQANPLISQVLNFGNPIPIDNPYLLKYSYRFSGGKSGVSAGFGFSSSSLELKEQGSNSKTSDLDFRAGYEWYIPMGDRFLFSIGPDLVFNGNNTNTVNISSVDFGGGFKDSTVNDTRSQAITFGGGGRLNFSVAITPRLLIGTEATLYYTFTDGESRTKIERFTFNGFSEVYTFEEEKEEFKTSDSGFQLPVAIFLTFRF